MTKEEQTLTKVELSNDDVATLYNILFSGITISARSARNVVSLQDWITNLALERKVLKSEKVK